MIMDWAQQPTLSGDAAKAHATVNLDRLGGLADGDVITVGQMLCYNSTVTYGNGYDHSTGTANSDVQMLILLRFYNSGFSIEYNSETNTLTLRNDTAGDSFTGTTLAINNAFTYDGAVVAASGFYAQNNGQPSNCKCNNR